MDKNALFKISYGLFVLTAASNGRDGGCIINTAFQATSSPCRVGVCVNKENFTHNLILKSNRFNISVLSEKADFEIFRHFGFNSGHTVDKFSNYTACRRSENGVYYITEGTNAYISVKVDSATDLGTHTLFIGEVTDSEVISDDASVTYDYYQKNIKPAPEEKTKHSGKTVWRCKICGYEYEGDTLPEDFVCPWCKHPAADFEKVIY